MQVAFLCSKFRLRPRYVLDNRSPVERRPDAVVVNYFAAANRQHYIGSTGRIDKGGIRVSGGNGVRLIQPHGDQVGAFAGSEGANVGRQAHRLSPAKRCEVQNVPRGDGFHVL